MATAAIDMSRPARWDRVRARLLLAITAGYGFSYTCRLVLGVVKKPLIDGGIYSPAELGTIGSALFAAYAVAKLVNGFVADHVDIRRFIAIGFACSALSCGAMGITTNETLATILSAFNGFFQSFGAPGCIIALAATFDDSDRGRAYGIWSTSHSVGEAITFFVLGGLAGTFGWRAGFGGAASAGLFAAALAWILLPAGRDALHPKSAPRAKGALLREQLSVLKLWPIWLLGLASALSYITRYGINSWGVLYLQEIHGYSITQAGTLLMVSNLAGIGGSLALGYASDLWFGGRRPPANLLFGLLEIGGLALVFFGGGPLALWIGMTVFGLGVGGVNASIGGLFAVDLAPRRCVGAVMGMIGSFSYLGSAVQEKVSGELIERGMTHAGATNHYDFTAAILFWMGAAVASMLIAAGFWRIEQKPLVE